MSRQVKINLTSEQEEAIRQCGEDSDCDSCPAKCQLGSCLAECITEEDFKAIKAGGKE